MATTDQAECALSMVLAPWQCCDRTTCDIGQQQTRHTLDWNCTPPISPISG
jgi:hypothetical protein